MDKKIFFPKRIFAVSLIVFAARAVLYTAIELCRLWEREATVLKQSVFLTILTCGLAVVLGAGWKRCMAVVMGGGVLFLFIVGGLLSVMWILMPFLLLLLLPGLLIAGAGLPLLAAGKRGMWRSMGSWVLGVIGGGVVWWVAEWVFNDSGWPAFLGIMGFYLCFAYTFPGYDGAGDWGSLRRLRRFGLAWGGVVLGWWVVYAFLPVYYVPVYHDGTGSHNLYYDPSAVSPELLDRMEGVCSRYGIWHRRTEGGILIRLCLFLDREMLWNYTSKAEGNSERPYRRAVAPHAEGDAAER